MNHLKAILYIFLLLTVTSCSITKHVPEGSYLLDRIKINTDVNDIPKEVLSEYLRQTPNSRVFGIFKMQLAIYNLSGKDTAKWINRTLRKIGDEPAMLNRIQTKISMQQLTQLYKNKGYMHASIDTIITYKDKKAKVEYQIKSNKPYRLGKYQVQIENELLTAIAMDTSRSTIRPDILFDTDLFEAERNRISSQFRQLGYYNFNKEFLIFNADSTFRSHKVNVTLVLSDEANPRFNPKAKSIFNRYKVRTITFYNRRDISVGANALNAQKFDTLQARGFTLIGDGNDEININTLIYNTYINPGNIYNDVSVEKTYSALNMLGAVKYVNISFKEVDDSNLDCQIIIVPSKTISMSAEAEATFTDGFWGVGGNLGIVDRNFMRGAEMLSVQGSSALEWQNSVLAQEWGAQLGLRFPMFLMPFMSFDARRNLHANTEVNTSYIYQFRPGEFTTINLGGGLKYRWLRTRYVHNFELANLSYVYFPSFSEEFRQTYLNTGRYNKYNYDDHFILRMGYMGSYSSFNAARPLQDYSTMRYSIESAGNLLYGINNTLRSKKTDDAYRIFNIRYAQYVRMEYNTTHHQIIDANNRFVFHLGSGIGVPYGNAEVIPYERRFYAGGANSVRGWSESTLGPGIYKRMDEKRRDYNQVGDIKIDLSMEYRAKMFWVLEGAAFLDAGNIWTIKNYPEQKGGVFDPTNFLRQLAIAYGAGLRFDFSFFIFRLDVGARLFDPVRNRREQWRIKPSSSDFAFHLAIGYPF